MHGKNGKQQVCKWRFNVQIQFLLCHLPQIKVKDDLSPRFKGNAQAQFSKQTVTQASHFMAWNSNPFLKWKHKSVSKQTTARPWTRKKELFCICVLNAVEKQGQGVRRSLRCTYSFTSFRQGIPQDLLQFDLFWLGWRKGRPLTPTLAPTLNTIMEKERTNHSAAAAMFHFYRFLLMLPPIMERGMV